MPLLLAIISWSRSTSRGRRRSRGRAKKPLIQARSVLPARATARVSRVAAIGDERADLHRVKAVPGGLLTSLKHALGSAVMPPGAP
jgi:hypothetical protein